MTEHEGHIEYIETRAIKLKCSYELSKYIHDLEVIVSSLESNIERLEYTLDDKIGDLTSMVNNLR